MYWLKKKKKRGEKKKKKKGKRERNWCVGAAVKRNIVHAPARRNICLLSVHTHSCRVRFFSGTNISPFPSLSFFSFLSYGSLSLSFSLFFPPSWLCKPTINPRRQLGISWRHDFTKPYRSPSTAAIQPTCILRCNFGRSCKRSIYLLCIPFGRWMVSYRLTWIFYRGIRIVRNAFEFFFFFFFFLIYWWDRKSVIRILEKLQKLFNVMSRFLRLW